MSLKSLRTLVERLTAQARPDDAPRVVAVDEGDIILPCGLGSEQAHWAGRHVDELDVPPKVVRGLCVEAVMGGPACPDHAAEESIP